MRLLFFTVGLMMAHQVIGKTARDAVFLVYFGKDALPAIKMVSALFAIGIGLTAPRLIQRYGTARAVPAAFVFSGLLHFFEFALRDVSPRAASILVYLHIVALSAILISGFWLLLSERFDPAEARRWFGRISGYGTVGGIAGGVLAAAWPSSGSSSLGLFFVMGVLHLVCGVCILLQARRTADEPTPVPVPFLSPFKAFSSAPYLRTMALLVFLGTTAAALLDIRFLSTAGDHFHAAGELVRFIAVFQAITQIACFLLQTFAVRHFLEWFSLGTNIGVLPAAVALGSFGSALFPGLGAITFARGGEYVARGSVFRSGLDIFYTPVPPAEKRAVKGFIDVICDRLGDAAGALITRLLVTPGSASFSPAVLVTAGAISLVSLFLSVRLGRGYSNVVHRGLTDRAVLIDEHLSRYGDWSLDTALLESLPRIRPSAPQAVPAPQGWAIPVPQIDETTRRLSALRSGDAARVRQTLALLDPPDATLVPAVVELLGWSEVWKDARAALSRTRQRHIGQFVDALADPDTDFSIRRRLPSLLAICGGQRAAAGLLEALGDARFEIRLHCARSLDVMVSADASLCPAQPVIQAAIARELAVTPQLWHSRSVIDDQASTPAGGGIGLQTSEGQPADYRLELLFSLLALHCEREPLKAAFRALHSADRVILALGLEYVDSLLPQHLRTQFRTLASQGVPDAPSRPARSAAEVASILLASQGGEVPAGGDQRPRDEGGGGLLGRP